MVDMDQVALLRNSVDRWNSWRGENELVRPNLIGADLNSADLRDSNLADADLSHANLSGADLREASLLESDLSFANLSGADLGWASLSGAVFFRANLRRTSLIGAELMTADLTGANLCGANLKDVYLYETKFGDTDLSDAKGLDQCRHLGPSIVDHRTLERSGPLPLAFLRGCGLPDRLIEYLPSLLDDPIQFYSCFISYASLDDAFALRLHADLQNRGVRCWFAPEDLKIGDELRSTFDEAIRVRDKLLIVLSETSIERPWVKREVEQALDEEGRRGEPVLFPIRLDDSVFDVSAGWATDVKRRYIGDFSAWKDHDAYQKAFERLLRDLKV